jgi:hypothetical protein
MQIQNKLIMAQNPELAESIMVDMGNQGYHLVSCVFMGGKWYLAFTNWASLFNTEQDDRMQVSAEPSI